MGTIANAKVTHYYNCYNGDFIGCLHYSTTYINTLLSDKNFQAINNLLIYIKLSNNFDKEACL